MQEIKSISFDSSSEIEGYIKLSEHFKDKIDKILSMPATPKYPKHLIVEVIANTSSHGFKIGELVKIRHHYELDNTYLCANAMNFIFFLREEDIKLSHKTTL